MTYAQIVDWVSEHFSPANFKSFSEMEAAIRERFEYDGVYFPEAASAHLRDYYADSFPEVQSPIATLDQFVAPEPEILSIDTDFFTVQPAPDFWTTAPARPAPFTPKGTAFGNIGRRFRSAFKKLFKL
jgi:hypothetical protein